MRGRQRKYKSLEDSVDERNKKLQAQLFSTCRDTRVEEYRKFINRYVSKASYKNTKDKKGSKYTVTNVLSSLIFWDSRIGQEFNDLTIDTLEQTVQDAVAGLPSSTHNARCGVIKTFFKRTGRPELARSIELVESKTHIQIEELVTAEDVARMISTCINARDRALISLIYESGARRGELIQLSITDTTPEQDGYRIRLNGKTGQRRILVIDSAQYLHQWLQVHPCRHVPSAPVFCTLGDGMRVVAVSSFDLIIRSAAKRAGIEGKRINPHAFRHAQATEKSRYFTDAQLRTYLGWAKNSNMPSVYDHLKGESLDDEIRKQHGMLPKILEPILEAIECPRCHRTLTGGVEYCGYCMMPISAEAREKIEAAQVQEMQERADISAALGAIKKEKASLAEEIAELKAIKAEFTKINPIDARRAEVNAKMPLITEDMIAELVQKYMREGLPKSMIPGPVYQVTLPIQSELSRLNTTSFANIDDAPTQKQKKQKRS